MKYTSVKGMEDILPGDSDRWQSVERAVRAHLESFGYSEIRTPILEDTALFIRSVGETTDIVTKEMFTFQDRKERSLTLRPEGTAPVVRAYIEHALYEKPRGSRLFYIGPMFRSERPQKGRSRQFHQIGTEVIGSMSPYADAEVIIQLAGMLQGIGIKDFIVKLNSLGCSGDKAKYSEELREYLKDKGSALCEDCVKRSEKNVLRVLDCKSETCKAVTAGAPKVSDSLCGECRGHFATLKNALSSAGVEFVETKNLVRGLDYYTRTVFEVTHPGLGAQDALAAGGRYDNLVKDLGGPQAGAVGYAIGVERLIIALNDSLSVERKVTVSIATVGDKAKIEGIKIAGRLRGEVGIPVITDISGASLKSQFRTSDKAQAALVVIIGEDELNKGVVVLRDMRSQSQKEVSAADLVGEIRTAIQKV